MDKQPRPYRGFTDEVCKGNLRISLTQFQGHDGSLKRVVGITAQDGWVGQERLLCAWSGMDLGDARKLFTVLTRNLRGYDWHDNEILLEESAGTL